MALDFDKFSQELKVPVESIGMFEEVMLSVDSNVFLTSSQPVIVPVAVVSSCFRFNGLKHFSKFFGS